MVRSKVKNLKELLVPAFGNDVEIVQEKYSMLTAPGEHYGSIMLALDVTIKKCGKEEVLNLVAKLVPANDMLKYVFNIGVTYKKEVATYLKVIPALKQFQNEFNVPKEHFLDIFPYCYGARISLKKGNDEVDDDAAIIFENLKVQGYEVEDRLIGFSFKDAKLIVRDLAKFHAVPLALRLVKPKEFQDIAGACTVKNMGLDRLTGDLKRAFHDSILEKARHIPELDQYYSRLEAAVKNAQANTHAEKPPPNDLYATIVHSDYWVNNTMILRDANGNAIKNKIVDFQLVAYDCALNDLMFFLLTSVVNSDLEQHYEELIRVYYNSFTDNLKDYGINLDPYSWENFMNEIEKAARNEFYSVVVMLKPIFTERGKVQNSLEEFQDSDWSREDLLGSAYKRKLTETVITYANRNWI